MSGSEIAAVDGFQRTDPYVKHRRGDYEPCARTVTHPLGATAPCVLPPHEGRCEALFIVRHRALS